MPSANIAPSSIAEARSKANSGSVLRLYEPGPDQFVSARGSITCHNPSACAQMAADVQRLVAIAQQPAAAPTPVAPAPLPHTAPQPRHAQPGAPQTIPRLQWKFNTGGPVRSSPAVAQGMVYIGSADDHLYALETRDGQPQ